MPCTSGLRPVVIEVQAGGVSGLRVDISWAAVPPRIRLVRKGSTPCCESGRSSEKVAPSSPIIKTLFVTTSPNPDGAGRGPRKRIRARSLKAHIQ